MGNWTQRVSDKDFGGINTWDAYQAGAATVSAIATAANAMQSVLSTVLCLNASGPPAYVQSADFCSANDVFLSSVSLAFSVPNAAGNCLVVDFAFDSSGNSFPGSLSISDSAGNSYGAPTTASLASGTGIWQFTWVLPGCRAGANTVTITTSASSPFNFGVYALAVTEYAGISTATPVGNTYFAFDVHSTGITTINAVSSGSQMLHWFTYTELFVAITASAGSNPPSPGVSTEGWYIVLEQPSGSPATGGGYTDRSRYLFIGAGQRHEGNLQARQRGNWNYTLIVADDDDYEPTLFTPVFFFDENPAGFTQVFSGIIQDFKARQIGLDGWRYYDVAAVSFEVIFDQVLVTEPLSFENTDTGTIVTALFNAFETGAQVSLGTIQAGATLPLFNANMGDKLSDLFTQLATTSEFTWNVNPQTLKLFFGAPNTVAAPFALTSPVTMWDSIATGVDGANYRNRQIVKLSYDALPQSSEFFIGSGQETFTLQRPVNQVVTVYITLSTPNTATASFSGVPSPGDTFTIGPAAGAWQASHVYGLGGVIVVNGYVQSVTTAGTSGGSQPAFSTVTGQTVQDNSVIWTCRGPLGLGTGDQTYIWVAASALDNTEFGQIAIQATVAECVTAMSQALNATAADRGVSFSLPTWENANINAVNIGSSSLTIQQKAAGSGPVSQLSATGSGALSFSSDFTVGGTSPQGSVGPNEGATISIQVYAEGTSTAAPGLAYTEGSAVVNLATPLNSGTNMQIVYTREDGNVIMCERTDLVGSLAVTTNGTGKVQVMSDQSSLGLIATNALAGLQLAQQALASYDVAPSDIDIQTLQPGIFPGMNVTLDLSGFWGALLNSGGANAVDVVSYNLSASTAHGLCYDNHGAIWQCDYGNGLINKVDRTDGSVLLSTSFPADTPFNCCYDAGTDTIWVLLNQSNTVAKLDRATGTDIGAYAVGNSSVGVVSDGTNIWVSNQGDGTVTKITAATGGIVGTYSAGSFPSVCIVVGTQLWVTNSVTGNTVSVLDLATGSLDFTYTTGNGPFGLCFDGTNIWICNQSDGTVSVLDQIGGVVATLTLPATAFPITCAFDGTNVWVVDDNLNTVYVFVAATQTQITFDTPPVVPDFPSWIAWDGTEMWVSSGPMADLNSLTLTTGTGKQWYCEETRVEYIPGINAHSPWVDQSQAPGGGHYRYTYHLINAAQINSYMDWWLNQGGGSGGSGGGPLAATSGGSQGTQYTGLSSGGVNEQTTDYTAVAADSGKDIVFDSSGSPVVPVTLTLPSIPPTAQWNIFVQNIGAGTLTVARNGLLIDGAATNLTLTTGLGVYITTDGVNYFTERGMSGLTNPMTTEGDIIYGGASGTPTRLAAGTSGDVLQTNGSGAAPTWVVPSGGGGPSSQSGNLAGAGRAKNTVYQNTTGKTVYVAVRFNGNGTSVYFECLTDSSNPPTNSVASTFLGQSLTGDGVTLFFIVLSGNYYKVDDVAIGGQTLFSWYEWS